MYEVRVPDTEKFVFHHTPNTLLILYKAQLLTLFRETIFVSLVRLPFVAGVFPLSLNVQIGSEGHSDPYSVWSGGSYLAGTAAWAPSSVDVKIVGSHCSHSSASYAGPCIILARHTQCTIIILAHHTQCTIIILAFRTRWIILSPQ